MKRLLLLATLALAAYTSPAQNCSAIITTAGNVKTQIQKATAASPDNDVKATLWLSRDNNGYYLHIVAVTNAGQKPFLIKATQGGYMQMTFIDGGVLESRLLSQNGTEMKIMLSNEIVSRITAVPLENISWYENSTTEPTLRVLVNDMAHTKLAEAIGCMK